jgi:hypothetical protein
MKTFLALIALMGLLSFSGCANLPNNGALPVQQALNSLLPADFRGDIDAGHKNAYFDFQIVATKLRKVGDTWRYDSLSYKRNGRFSTGWVTVKGESDDVKRAHDE